MTAATGTVPPATRGDDALPRPLVPLLVALGAALYLLPLAMGTPLLDPDEGLHAAIAQEMVERGDWVTPRWLGTPFLDKPILFFWALAASIAALPDGELAVKLPGLAFGALGALAAGLLARRLVGPRAGVLAALAQATMLLPMAVAQGAVHDVALVPWTTLAMLGLWDAAQAGSWRRATAAGAVAGVWLGLAVLTKALTGVALVGLPFAIWALATRRLGPRLVAAGLVSLGVAALVSAPWYLAMEAANPGYFHYYFVERHLLGYATTTQLHGQRAWWYYGPILAAGALPWLPYALTTLGATVRDRHPGLLLAWTWLVVDVVFLSLAGSKLLTYLLPAFPAVALLAGAAWDTALGAGGRGAPAGAAWRACHVVAMTPLAVALAAPTLMIGRQLGLDIGATGWAAIGLASVAWVAALVVGLTRGPDRTLVAIAAGWVVTALVGVAVALPRVAPAYTARELARHYNRAGVLPAQIWFFAERVGSFIYYLDPALRASLTAERVQMMRPDEVMRLRVAIDGVEVIVPVELMPRLDRRIPLSAQPSVLAGHHRIFEAAAFGAAVRAVTGAR